MKKALSFLTALIMLVCTLNVGVFASAYDYAPYTAYDNDGKLVYCRLSNGRYIDFNTDYDDMVECIRDWLINRESVDVPTLDYRFATTDTTWEYYYYDNVQSQRDAAQAAANALLNQVLADVFGDTADDAGTAGGGDYLYKNIEASATVNGYGIGTAGYYSSSFDDPMEGAERYFTFELTFSDVEYNTTDLQEAVLKSFADWFKTNYIYANNAPSVTPYEKVKIIYDFIVRNCKYDQELYEAVGRGESYDQTRYQIAHSAYGALLGNNPELLDATSPDIDFDKYFCTKTTVANQPVCKNYDNGRAVCEGYSRLFHYLCVSNGIRCRIVDGNYLAEANKPSDPHEWNYVYLDDGQGDGWQWYQVDCTFASQKSYKQIDLNNYEYFLGGYDSVFFGKKNHQQAYENRGAGILPQLYDWYAQGNKLFQKDYRFSKVELLQDKLEQGYILKRTTYHADEDKDYTGFILCNSDGMQLVEINEDGIYFEETDGFIYSGLYSRFEVMLPYIVNRINITDTGRYSEGEYVSPLYVTDTQTGDKLMNVKNCGEYSIEIDGSDDTKLIIVFTIEQRDMSNAALDGKSVITADTYANYTGNAITPNVSVIDPYENNLVKGRDFTLGFTMNGTTVSEIKNIGDYKVIIEYMGNYKGRYVIDFTVDKIKLENLTTKALSFQYYPLAIRQKKNLLTPVDYYKTGTANGITVGDLTLYPDVDFSVSSSGSVEYGKSGTVVIKGLSGGKVIKDSKKSISYKVDKKYSISYLDGGVADTNTTNKVYYTGGEVKPTHFDAIDNTLVQGKDYEIVSYSNNINIGYAYVSIKGIGGCTGSAKLKFYINRPEGLVEPSTSGNIVKASCQQYVYSGKANKPKITFKNAKGKAVSTFFYTVSYSNYTKVGTACVTIKLRNGYSGTFKINYVILPKATKITGISSGKGKVTLSWKKQATQTTGYQIQYSTSPKYKNATKLTITSTSTTRRTIKKLKRKKLYYFRVRTYKLKNGKKYYSAWSSGMGIYTK